MDKVKNVKRGYFNKRPVKFFELWEFRNNAWYFVSKHVAPRNVPNKELCQWAREKEN